MKRTAHVLHILVLAALSHQKQNPPPSPVIVAETYQQCKQRVQKGIADYENLTGKIISAENKELTINIDCVYKLGAVK